MNNFNSILAQVLAVLGLIIPERIRNLLQIFYSAANRQKGIPCALLTGFPGAGKTSLAEAFARAVGGKTFFYQCVPGTGSDQLLATVNMSAVVRHDADRCVADGVLVKAVKEAQAGRDVVLILDEIDKASPETDAFLLDFLQSRRVTDSNNCLLVAPSDVRIWVFLTSNDERDLSDALMRRVRRWEVERPSRSTVAEVLGVQESCALLDVWESSPKLAISQLENYIQDGGDPEDLNRDILAQYVTDLPEVLEPGDIVEPEFEPVQDVFNLDSLKSIQGLNGLRWEFHEAGSVKVWVRTVTELFRLREAVEAPEMIHLQDRNGWSSGSADAGLELDCMEPVLVAKDKRSAIFSVGGKTFVAKAAGGKWYLPWNASDVNSRIADSEILSAICSMEQAWRKGEFKAKQAEERKETRKEVSTAKARSLLERLGMEDLL